MTANANTALHCKTNDPDEAEEKTIYVMCQVRLLQALTNPVRYAKEARKSGVGPQIIANAGSRHILPCG